jgi:predicted Zn finger-like uncharacterized protein
VFTRCPACHTVHPVNAALLAQGNGRYLCGRCNKTSNALAALFDRWPDAGERPRERGELPILGVAIKLQAEPPEPDSNETDEALQLQAAERTRRLFRVFWITAAIALFIATAINLAVFFGHPLRQQPLVQNVLARFGIMDEAPVEPWRDLSKIQLVSRDMQNRPSQPGTLLLSLTMVNRAQLRQPYPALEVILLDQEGKPLARRIFQAAEYLPPGADTAAGMVPEAYLPVNLKLLDPGQKAVGFEINFLR